MLSKLFGAFFNSVIGGILKMWESSKRDAQNIEKGADIVIKEQLKDEVEKAKRAKEVAADVRDDSDDDIDSGMRRPS